MTILTSRVIFLVPFVILASRSLLTAGEKGKIAGQVVDRSIQESLAGTNFIVNAVWTEDQEIELDFTPGMAIDLNGEYFILNLRPGDILTGIT
jgi:hypothetical protein